MGGFPCSNPFGSTALHHSKSAWSPGVEFHKKRNSTFPTGLHFVVQLGPDNLLALLQMMHFFDSDTEMTSQFLGGHNGGTLSSVVFTKKKIIV